MTRERPIWRWPWNLSAGVCAMMLALVVAAWLSSHGWLPFHMNYRQTQANRLGYTLNLRNDNGGMTILIERGTMRGNWMAISINLPFLRWQELPGCWTFIHVRHWALAMPPASVVACWLVVAYRNAHRPRPGHCHQCGYNLTGTLAAGRNECPECGTAVKKYESVT